MQTEGEGNGKKLSKKRSAETMLVELRKLPPPPPSPVTELVNGTTSTSLSAANGDVVATVAGTATGQPLPSAGRVKSNKRKPPIVKKKRNLIKENVEEDTNDVNPISRLIHIAQSNKAAVPVYTLIEERGSPRRREFIMEVVAVQQKAEGVGSTKKLAKRQAAESMYFFLAMYLNALDLIFVFFVYSDLLELLANSTDPAVRALCQPSNSGGDGTTTTTTTADKCKRADDSVRNGRQLAPAAPSGKIDGTFNFNIKQILINRKIKKIL